MLYLPHPLRNFAVHADFVASVFSFYSPVSIFLENLVKNQNDAYVLSFLENKTLKYKSRKMKFVPLNLPFQIFLKVRDL